MRLDKIYEGGVYVYRPERNSEILLVQVVGITENQMGPLSEHLAKVEKIAGVNRGERFFSKFKNLKKSYAKI